MKPLWRRLQQSDSGASAVEFAFVLPILVTLLLFGANSWLQTNQAHDMSTGLHAGARYYENGGTDDADARTLALSAWPNAPLDATVAVARTCKCGDSPVACASTCGTATPQTFVDLTATSTFKGLTGESQLTGHETIRVR